MAERKKIIFKVIKENVQGFWQWDDLIAYHAKIRKEYYELSDNLLRIFLESRTSIFIPCPFEHIKTYGHNKYEDELVSLYVERMWVIASNEVVILFKNGSMVREEWHY